MKLIANISLSLLIIFILLPYSFAQTPKANETMNGIKFNDYLEFLTKWKLITVRYRVDNGELRFIYANPLAVKSFQNKWTKFPEGAVLAKIGYATVNDPKFPSSVLPDKVARVQFMVKNSARYPEQGWGYAIFTGDGKLMSDKNSTDPKTCMACHQVVPERDYVFSVPTNEKLIPVTVTSAPVKDTGPVKGLQFKTTKVDELTNQELLRVLKNENQNEVQLLVNEQLTTHAFIGTAHEITLLLSAESFRSKKAALFIDKTQTIIQLIIPNSNQDCVLGGKKGLMMKPYTLLPHLPGSGFPKEKIIMPNKNFCWKY